jgi:CDP-diacylglycerol--glycerol-3-phosphate 3-phosphatidyltransferase
MNMQESEKSKQRINLPNKLTIVRIILVPVCMLLILIPIPEVWAKILAASVFMLASFTDMLDGLIARRFNLITNFGKLMDPLADKLLTVGSLIAITASDLFAEIRPFVALVATIVFFREFAVTSLRLVANSADDNVIAANSVGKLKTIVQIVCIMTILLESVVLTNHLNTPDYLFSYITMALMSALTIYSGVIYFKTYWVYVDPTK